MFFVRLHSNRKNPTGWKNLILVLLVPKTPVSLREISCLQSEQVPFCFSCSIKRGAFSIMAAGTVFCAHHAWSLALIFIGAILLTENLFARGFEFDPAHADKIELITSFECFEHFADPNKEIEKMLSISSSILFSTETFSSGTPDPDHWNYYYFPMDNIFLYFLIFVPLYRKKYNLHFYSNGKELSFIDPSSIKTILLFNILLKMSLLGIYSMTAL